MILFISGYSKCIGYIVATTVEHIKYSRVKGFGTGGYACIYDGKTCAILTHGGKPFKNVRAIIADKKGNIWLVWRFWMLPKDLFFVKSSDKPCCNNYNNLSKLCFYLYYLELFYTIYLYLSLFKTCYLKRKTRVWTTMSYDWINILLKRFSIYIGNHW